MINYERIDSRIQELSTIEKTNDGGVTRLAFSKALLKAQDIVKDWMAEAGLTVQQDPAGNVIGRKEGEIKNAKPIVIGSHIDSVSNGGKYDGTMGVICAIEVAQYILENNIRIKRPLEVISFSEEEASRFGNAFFGSMAFTGTFTQEDLDRKDVNGISRKEAMKECGFDPDLLFADVARKKGEQELYLEMHIEQGPVLEQKDISVGIVKGIPGIIMSQVSIVGKSNHIGGTPMNMRQDALLGASELIEQVEKTCLDFGDSAVGAVGSLHVYPGETNIIPGKVELSIDIRHLDREQLNHMYQTIQEASERIARKRDLNFTFNEKKTQPSPSSTEVIQVMEEKSKELDIEALVMASGGGHDAQIMAELSDMGMIFVRSTGGSHNPEEYAAIEDIAKGTELLLDTAVHYLNK
ncbi:M20 family metallo-hydrolase [Lentibacillus sp. N15]|uniref:M20 family metallo-hydrolase n=1 Tax=Lentibacillus songyuanensis TaxID=3136161 RepID=UPI0031BB702F